MAITLDQSRWYRRDQRRFSKPVALLPACRPTPGGSWLDLGCGDGIFSAVLADLLGSGGLIVGLDRDESALRHLGEHMQELGWSSRCQPVLADLARPLPCRPLDGLVAANSLHFLRHGTKASVLRASLRCLRPGGRWIVVEYDHASGSSAVPHPLTAAGWIELLRAAGLVKVRLAARTPSRFLGQMAAITGVRAG